MLKCKIYKVVIPISAGWWETKQKGIFFLFQKKKNELKINENRKNVKKNSWKMVEENQLSITPFP